MLSRWVLSATALVVLLGLLFAAIARPFFGLLYGEEFLPAHVITVLRGTATDVEDGDLAGAKQMCDRLLADPKFAGLGADEHAVMKEKLRCERRHIDYLADLGRLVSAGGEAGRRNALQAAFSAIREYETQLARQLLTGLAEMEHIKVWGITDLDRLSGRRLVESG